MANAFEAQWPKGLLWPGHDTSAACAVTALGAGVRETEEGGASAVATKPEPHALQKRASPGLSCPQSGQNIADAVRIR